MKALLQNFGNGELGVTEIPTPALRPGGILVQNAASLVSAGTEKKIIELAKMNPLKKAKARPDLVRKLLRRVGQEGIIGTTKTVMNLINMPIPLGYSCAGIVRAVGQGVTSINIGDAVACAGLGHANHAEMVFIPQNLAVRIPKSVSFDEASFVTVGAIAMQGVRQADVRIGENVVVLGLGLVGQLAAQICSASGCRVFGIDVDPSKVKLARELGMLDGASLDQDVSFMLQKFTAGRGADAVVITAATKSSQPIELAAKLARDRARVVVVGDVKMNIPRRDYYEKELDIRLSRSYGPGRYDIAYEEKGQDYPLGYVRWTENRNMEAFLDLVFQKKVNAARLITHRFPIQSAHKAYDLLSGSKTEPFIGILLDYDTKAVLNPTVCVQLKKSGLEKGAVGFGIIGAGQFAQGVLLPYLAKIRDVSIRSVATGSGISAQTVAKKYDCSNCTSDYKEILSNEHIHAVLIATQHHQHAQMVADALASGKHTFVEKPLAIKESQLDLISETVAQLRAKQKEVPLLMVGYNRRFSPFAQKAKEAFDGEALVMNYRVNAGPVPKDHWTQDLELGGGRIVGEVCHFVDLMQFLTNSLVAEVFAWPLGDAGEMPEPDSLNIQLKFESGSIGTIHYIANGDPSFPKERLEIFGGGRVSVIDNWRKFEICGRGMHVRESSMFTSKKGLAEELQRFVTGIREGKAPISLESLIQTTKATFAIQASLRHGRPVAVNLADPHE
jgi:predicted dehydrogenase/threonine dehydrogenase-like Zn-dependent dehydrogenase